MEYLLEKIQDVFERSKRMKSTMCFSFNSSFPDCVNPFITEEDIQRGRLIIRDREFDRKKWVQNEAKFRWAGITEWDCYDSNSRIVKTYYSMEDMAKEGWNPDKWKH